MGLEHCTGKCEEYCTPCHTYEFKLTNQTFNNPFFQKDNNETLESNKKDLLNVDINSNNINDFGLDEVSIKKKKKENLEILKKKYWKMKKKIYNKKF